jgi:hypothetical protein
MYPTSLVKLPVFQTKPGQPAEYSEANFRHTSIPCKYNHIFILTMCFVQIMPRLKLHQNIRRTLATSSFFIHHETHGLKHLHSCLITIATFYVQRCNHCEILITDIFEFCCVSANRVQSEILKFTFVLHDFCLKVVCVYNRRSTTALNIEGSCYVEFTSMKPKISSKM